MPSSIYWTLVPFDQVPFEQAQAFLSEAEIQRLEEMRFPKRREDWLSGRWAGKRLAQVVSPRSDRSLAELEIKNSPAGAPILLESGGSTRPESLSLSHSHRLAFCALVTHPELRIGADLEKIEPRSEAFIADYFTPAEQTLVECTPASLKQTVVTLIWSTKESMLKALGVGLHWDTRKVEVGGIEDLSPLDLRPRSWHSLRLGDDQDKERRWVGWWPCRRDFVITLAGFGPSPDALRSVRLVEKQVC